MIIVNLLIYAMHNCIISFCASVEPPRAIGMSLMVFNGFFIFQQLDN